MRSRRLTLVVGILATSPSCSEDGHPSSGAIPDAAISDASRVSHSDASRSFEVSDASHVSHSDASQSFEVSDARKPPGAARPDASGATRSSVSLASLSVSPLPLSPSFSPEIHDYAVRCAAGVNTLELSWAAAGGASVSLVTPARADGSSPRLATALDGSAQSARPASGSLLRDAGVLDGSRSRSETVSYGSSARGVAVELAEDQAAVLRVDGAPPVDEYWIRCLPHDFPTILVTENADAGALGEGYFLFGTAVEPPGDGSFAMVLDTHGTPVWYLRAAQTVFNLDLVAPNVISFMVNTAPAGFGTDPNASYELRDLASGNRTYVKAVGTPTDLHEFRTLSNGDHLVQAYDIVRGVDLTGLQKFGPGSTVADCILQELDGAGAVVWSWRASDHIDIVRESTIPQAPVLDGETVVDPIHLNSEDEAENGDLLVSARHLDAVFLVSKATGKIVWKLGGTAYSRDGAQLLRLQGDTGFFRQHDARFLSKDTITLFDDESLISAPARAVAYSIDLASGTATRIWQDVGPASSIAMGSARVLADGHVVAGWGLPASGHVAVTEFDGTGHDLFEIAFPSGEPSYRGVKVPAGSFDVDVLRRSVGNE